MFKIGAQK